MSKLNQQTGFLQETEIFPCSDCQNCVPIPFTINGSPQSRRGRRGDIGFTFRCPTTPLPSAPLRTGGQMGKRTSPSAGSLRLRSEQAGQAGKPFDSPCSLPSTRSGQTGQRANRL